MGLKSFTARLSQPQNLRSAYLTFWVFLVVWSYVKGFNPGVQVWGKYFWLIDYSEGLIKRGFLGTFLHSLGYTIKNMGWERLQILVLMLHTLTALLMVALLIKIQQKFFLNREEPEFRQVSVLLSACWLIFACTQFWPTLAFNNGYADIYLLFAYIYAFYLFSRGQYIGGAIVGCIAVLIHEAFVFLWLNILAVFILVPFLESRRVNRRILALSFFPFLTTILLLLLHDQAAVISEINSVPAPVIEQEMKAILINAQFGQTIRSATQVMLDIWNANMMRGLAALGYYTFPAILMILSIPLLLENHRDRMVKMLLIVLVASYLPLSILLIAWDLSRFLVWVNLTTVLTLTYCFTRVLNQFGVKESL